MSKITTLGHVKAIILLWKDGKEERLTFNELFYVPELLSEDLHTLYLLIFTTREIGAYILIRDKETQSHSPNQL